MFIRLTITLLLGCILAGCKSVEGVYLPACAAYAGDRIELRNGEFDWDKFTDQVDIDEKGARIDPFPEFPRRGSYEIDGSAVRMTMNNNVSETLYLHAYDGRALLLTEAQHRAVESGGRYDDCALTRAEQ